MIDQSGTTAAEIFQCPGECWSHSFQCPMYDKEEGKCKLGYSDDIIGVIREGCGI